ncbi:YcaO-like family protein [Lysobacter enzymogenes]|uniref:YcaO-like family protein n=1 Tax=Lysobacter enzymogenes TaxID=69 RepID=UPI0009CDA68E|nr:YcaO-like family protein [Lysobacter enzymogenes]UZW58587.1 YcaO-like family protein [Lysobacter enzymogenes]
MIPLERERSLDEAERAMRDFLGAQGWRAELERVGAPFAATICSLYDQADGRLLGNGFGKGEADPSRVGALFEAVEHLFTGKAPAHAVLSLRSGADCLADPLLAQLPVRAAFAQQPDRRLACRRYRAFAAGEPDAVLPLFLSYPTYLDWRAPQDDFDYASALRFGSNNGTAIGSSLAEAAVHAIGELIERDAWSLFLVGHFLGDPAAHGYLLPAQELPAALARRLSEAEAQLQREIVLIDATSDLGVPCIIATASDLRDGESIHPCGYGASLYPEHAAMRAITELVQALELPHLQPRLAGYSQAVLNALSAYPKLRDCAVFAIDRARLRRRRWDFQAPAPLPPTALLELLTARLRARGIDLHYAINHHEPGHFCVINVVSLALERFFLVCSGIVMAPGQRGRDLLAGRLPVPGSAAALDREAGLMPA